MLMIIGIAVILCTLATLIFALCNHFYFKNKYTFLEIYAPLGFSLFFIYLLYKKVGY